MRISLFIIVFLANIHLQAEELSVSAILQRKYPYTVSKNVPYCNNISPSQKMDIYTPKDSKDAPGLILLHGGGWGGRDKGHKNFVAMADLYAKRGFVVFNVNYRLSKEAPAPAAVQDVHCAWRYIWGHADTYGIDRKRIALTGNSAGCHLGLMLALCDTPQCKGTGPWQEEKPKLRAVINRFAITDVHERAFGKKPRSSALRWLNVAGNQKELAIAMSPLTYTGKEGAPPIYTIHGAKDFNTPVSQGIRLHEQLLSAGNHSELLVIEKGNHGLHNLSQTELDDLYRKKFDFLLRMGLFKAKHTDVSLLARKKERKQQ